MAEHDLRGFLRGGASDKTVREFLREVAWPKAARRHLGKAEFVQPARTGASHFLGDFVFSLSSTVLWMGLREKTDTGKERHGEIKQL